MWLSWRVGRLSAAIRILLRLLLEERCAQWTCAGMSRITYSYIRRRSVTTTSPHLIALRGLDFVLFPVWAETGAPGSSADSIDRQCGTPHVQPGPKAPRPLAGTRSSGTWDFRSAVQPKTCFMLRQVLLMVNWPYRLQVKTSTGLHLPAVT